MAGTGPGDLYAIATELLDASVEALDSIPVFDPGLTGAPDRSFVSPGQPAFDCCDQLTVHVAGVTEFPIGQVDTHKESARKNLVTFVVTSVRCLAQSVGDTPPDADALQQDAEQLDADGWALWNHLWNLMRSGDLFTLCGTCHMGWPPLPHTFWRLWRLDAHDQRRGGGVRGTLTEGAACPRTSMT